MSKIKMELDVLDTLSGQIKSKIAEFNSIQEQYRALNQSIQSSWEGAAMETYSQMTDQFRRNQDMMQQILQTFQDYTQESASSFRSLDQECAHRIRSSF